MRTSLSSAFAGLFACLLGACGGSSSTSPPTTPTTPTSPAPPPSVYSQTNLVSASAIAGTRGDIHLINPWGIVFGAGAPVWIANNGTQTSTLTNGTGGPNPLVVNLPAGINGAADPTGIVANATVDFIVTGVTGSASARFIFDGEGGTIIGWAPTVDRLNGIIMYDDGTGGAVYKGLAIANDGTSNFLYAADFHNKKVDVFDAHFHKVTASGGFTDPTLPSGYSPFNIQTLTVNGTPVIYVAYAMTHAGSDDEVAGAGMKWPEPAWVS